MVEQRAAYQNARLLSKVGKIFPTAVPFKHPLFEGHFTFERVTKNHPKKVTKNCQERVKQILFECLHFTPPEN